MIQKNYRIFFSIFVDFSLKEKLIFESYNFFNDVRVSFIDMKWTIQDRGGKNSWQSEQDFLKCKDNCSRDRIKDNRSWVKHPMDEPKCNIQKESKMMGSGVGPQPPRITHTAATPQDSPNTTLDTGYRELNCRTVYPTNLSIESIDRSGVRFYSTLFLKLFPSRKALPFANVSLRGKFMNWIFFTLVYSEFFIFYFLILV